MRQVSRTLTTADDGLLRAHRVLICDRDAKWSGEVRRLLERWRHPGCADAVAGAQCECPRRALRPVHQTGMSRSRHSARRAALPADRVRVRRALSSRTQSSRAGQYVDRRDRAQSTSGSDPSASTTRWPPELLRAGRVTIGTSGAHRLGPQVGHYEMQLRNWSLFIATSRRGRRVVLSSGFQDRRLPAARFARQSARASHPVPAENVIGHFGPPFVGWLH